MQVPRCESAWHLEPSVSPGCVTCAIITDCQPRSCILPYMPWSAASQLRQAASCSAMKEFVPGFAGAETLLGVDALRERSVCRIKAVRRRLQGQQAECTATEATALGRLPLTDTLWSGRSVVTVVGGQQQRCLVGLALDCNWPWTGRGWPLECPWLSPGD